MFATCGPQVSLVNKAQQQVFQPFNRCCNPISPFQCCERKIACVADNSKILLLHCLRDGCSELVRRINSLVEGLNGGIPLTVDG